MIVTCLGVTLLVALIVCLGHRHKAPSEREPLAPGCGMRESVDPANVPFFKPEWQSRRFVNINAHAKYSDVPVADQAAGRFDS